MNRIEKIKIYAVEEEARKNFEMEQKKVEELKTVKKIESLWDRAKELIDTYNACVDANIKMPKESSLDRLDMFTANAISHRLGFGVINPDLSTFGIANEKYRDSLAVHGGGCANCEVVLYKGELFYKGNDWDRAWAMKRFLDQFDEFESKFYAWVDKITENV